MTELSVHIKAEAEYVVKWLSYFLPSRQMTTKLKHKYPNTALQQAYPEAVAEQETVASTLFRVHHAHNPTSDDCDLEIEVTPIGRDRTYLDTWCNDYGKDSLRVILSEMAKVWPEVAEQLKDQDAKGLGPSENKGQQEQKPWEVIADGTWEREAVRMWHVGYTKPEIADQLKGTHRLETHTIENRFSELRRTFGREVVPTLDDLRRKGLRGRKTSK